LQFAVEALEKLTSGDRRLPPRCLLIGQFFTDVVRFVMFVRAAASGAG
jgi:hypothetical protein